MRSMALKTGKGVLYNFSSMVLTFCYKLWWKDMKVAS